MFSETEISSILVCDYNNNISIYASAESMLHYPICRYPYFSLRCVWIFVVKVYQWVDKSALKTRNPTVWLNTVPPPDLVCYFHIWFYCNREKICTYMYVLSTLQSTCKHTDVYIFTHLAHTANRQKAAIFRARSLSTEKGIFSSYSDGTWNVTPR